MTTEIKVTRGFAVSSGVGDPLTNVKLIIIDEGTLIVHHDDGEVVILAARNWNRVQVVVDDTYVPPAPPAPPVPDVSMIDLTTEPEDGWLPDEDRVTYTEIMDAYDGDIRATWYRLVEAGLPVKPIIDDDGTSAEEFWDSAAAVARRLRPIVSDKTMADAPVADDDIVGYL